MKIHCIWCGKPISVEYGRNGYTNGKKFCSPECFEYYAMNSGERFTVKELLDWLPEGQQYCLDTMFNTPVKERFGKREGYLLSEEVRKKTVVDLYVDDGINRSIEVGGMIYLRSEYGVIHFSPPSRFMVSVWKRRCRQ